MSSTPDASLYVPRFNAMDAGGVRPFVDAVATAQLVTVGEDGIPDATFLPVLWDGDRLVGHLARANPHWRRIVDGSPALAIVTGPDAYVSPSWYATKREHGKVVPTWNYSVVHLRGRITVHDDATWVRGLVTRLTDRHESARDEPWAVTDAPADYVEKNLRPIVGVEVVVESVEAKAKLSQNRSDADRAGVATGLVADGRDADGLVAP
ncbi:FMN-binding negative transcriptional regulator [Nocardioides hwasunensis]|uniref:FMN-binding negative transcriptional regulator n=1 Tax=Nocardioides hwasunensis TaxID=397258 RepID=UPI0029642B09|nr:FMN-binding negative transcriptional regulator [Nocardioides hwasunensis]